MRSARRAISLKRLSGFAVMLVLAMLWAISTRYCIGWNNGKGTTVDLWSGGVYIESGSRDASSKPGTLFYAVYSPGDVHYWFVIRSSPQSNWYFAPLWVPVLLSVLVNVWLWRTTLFATVSRRAGRCTNCSYDRRGIDAAAPCPECGAAP